jgi:2-amino-4-hydroxy-6-hydroxymethyldihydropteridine diphosphokinase
MDGGWTRALIGLGSNLKDPPRQLSAAVEGLGQLPASRLTAVAPRYWSAPWGPPGQPRYLNSAAALDTRLSPADLLVALQALERQLGKVPPKERFGPRSIDLDLLTHGGAVLEGPELILPHPRLHERAFVLYPLRDIAPDDWIPGRGRVHDLAMAVDGSGTVPEESERAP